MTPAVTACAVAFVVAGLASAVSLPGWRALCRRWDHVDVPGHRKIHGRPIPLAGGFAVFSGWILGALLWPFLDTFLRFEGVRSGAFGERIDAGVTSAVVGGGALGMLLLGAWDDRKDLGAGVKFLGQGIIAAAVAAWGVRFPLPEGMAPLGFGLTVFWILTVTNAFNLSDNMNGLCAGLGLIGAAWISASSLLLHGRSDLAFAAALVAGGLAGYLPYNYPRASVFLGDAGSQSVGFILSVLSLQTLTTSPEELGRTAAGTGLDPGRWAWLGAFWAVAVPCIDLLFVSVARTLQGRPFWVGDTGHLSHRLARTRLGKAGAVALLWALGTLLGSFLCL